MAAQAALRKTVTAAAPAGRHTASVIFLHGSGDTGPGVRDWIKQVLQQDLCFEHIKVIYPTAPESVYIHTQLLFKLACESTGIRTGGDHSCCQWDGSQETSGAGTSGLIYMKLDCQENKPLLFCCNRNGGPNGATSTQI